MLTRACQPGWELVLLSLIIWGEIIYLARKCTTEVDETVGCSGAYLRAAKPAGPCFGEDKWPQEYHKQHLRNDILTKLLELARVLGRGPWGGPGQRILAHLNYLLGLKSSRRADPQPATACPAALCGAGKGSAAAAAAVCEGGTYPGHLGGDEVYKWAWLSSWTVSSWKNPLLLAPEEMLPFTSSSRSFFQTIFGFSHY